VRFFRSDTFRYSFFGLGLGLGLGARRNPRAGIPPRRSALAFRASVPRWRSTRAFRAGVPRGRPARQPGLGLEFDRLGFGPWWELESDLRTGWRILTNSPVLSVPVLLQTDMKPWRLEEREGERKY